MEEFLKENYNFLTHSVEIMAAVTGLLLYKKYRATTAGFFIWIIVYFAFCDGFGEYSNYVKFDGIFNFLEGTLFESNLWWFNIFWQFGSAVILGVYYQKILKNKKNKIFLKYVSLLHVLSSLVYFGIYFQEIFTTSTPFITISGAAVIILCAIFYFIEILQSEKILRFYKDLNFYVSGTILFFWLIITPLVFYDIYFGTRDWDFIILKWQIYLFANIFMYSMFTFALIFSDANND